MMIKVDAEETSLPQKNGALIDDERREFLWKWLASNVGLNPSQNCR